MASSADPVLLRPLPPQAHTAWQALPTAPTSSLPPVLASLALPGSHTSSYLTPEPHSGPVFPTVAEKALTKGSAEETPSQGQRPWLDLHPRVWVTGSGSHSQLRVHVAEQWGHPLARPLQHSLEAPGLGRS